ncbi:MAG: matrixin family metalloprotease [Myxococcota bacterium]
MTLHLHAKPWNCAHIASTLFQDCRWLLFGVFFLFFNPPSTQAFVRTSAQGNRGKIHLFWNSFPVKYKINRIGTPDVKNIDAVYQAVEAGFNAWSQPSCTCFRAEFDGLTSVQESRYDNENDQNVIFFQSQEWEHNSQAVAVASVIFSRDTGQIFGFDIEFNNINFRFSIDGRPLQVGRREIPTVDIQNTLTHEAGHAVGLDHSDEIQSTMFASAPPGETSKRDLHTDDIAGICSLYKVNSDGLCQIDRTSQFLEQGCQCNHFQPSSSLPLFLLLLGFLLWRRQHRTSPQPTHL